jgi:hypothetical protein
MPFVLTMPRADRVEDWLQPTHFTKTALEDFDERDVKDFIPRLRVAFVLLAESNVAVFADERAHDAESLDQLQTAVNAARAALGNLFGSTFARPNTHTSGSHLAEAADRFAVPKNFDVRMLETNHGPFRRFIARSSNTGIERQIMEWENIKQALLFLAR